MPSSNDPQVIEIKTEGYAFVFEMHTIGRRGFCGPCLACGNFAKPQETIWFSSRYNDTLCGPCGQEDVQWVGELLAAREPGRQDGYRDHFARTMKTARLLTDARYAEGICRAKQDDRLGIGSDRESMLETVSA